jgi:hypothetical protein
MRTQVSKRARRPFPLFPHFARAPANDNDRLKEVRFFPNSFTMRAFMFRNFSQGAGARGVLVTFLLMFCAVLGWGWIRQTPSFEEMVAGAARGGDFFFGMRSVTGWPWWSPNYLFGHSLSFFGVSLIPLAVNHAFAWVCGPLGDPLVAPKLIGLAIIFFAGLAMYAAARRLLGGGWAGAFAGILYAASAQLVLRLAMLEHQSTAACMVFAPLILLGMLRCEERIAWRSAALLALAVSAMAMCYLKILLLFLPAGGAFFLWRLAAGTPDVRKNLAVGCLRGALITVPLAVLPMLPILRESGFLAMFELEPFAGWQQNYSFFSAVAWVDWGNVFTAGTAIPSMAGDRHVSVEFYLGPVVVAGIFFPLWLARTRAVWSGHPAWGTLRFFTAMLLLATWFASGPRSVIASHFAYLSGSFGCPDFSIPLVWAMLIVPGLLIFLLCGRGNIRLGCAAAGCLAFYFVPGFRLLELIPFFRDIRAPSAVWPAFGTLAAVLAAGAGWALLAGLPMSGKIRAAVLAAVLGFMALDVSFLHRAFFREGLPEKTFSDYAEAQAFLAKAATGGRVQAVSGRYFYLTTPLASGRALTAEALLRHFQLRWIRYMEAGSMISPETMAAYFDLFGISHILIDRLDPDTPKEYQERFKKIFPTVFENPGFTVLENASSLYPAYAAKNIVLADEGIFRNPGAVLQLGRGGLVAVEGASGAGVGKAGVQGEPDIPGRVELEKSVLLKRLALRAPRPANYHSFTVSGLGAGDVPGVVVATEAFHPDWKASQNGVPLPVLRSVGALLSVEVAAPGDITFRFCPPWYYNALMTACLAAWAAVAAAFVLARTRMLPAAWLRAWYGGTGFQPSHVEDSTPGRVGRI